MSTLFVWTGKGGPDWSSTSGTITNWQIPGGSNTIVPSAGTTLEAVAVFNDAGIHTVGGGGDADQIAISNTTTVTLTGARFQAGASDPAQNAGFPDDLTVEEGSKLIIASGAGMQNSGKVSVIGIGTGIFGASGTAVMEVDPGGLFTSEDLIIGDSTDDVGAVTVNGALEFDIVHDSTIGAGQLTIGYSGAGCLEITNTANVFMESVVLGLNQGAVGSLSLDSSMWGGGGVTLGAAGTGHMTIGAGATVALLDIIVGEASTASGDLTVTGANSFGVDFLTIGAAGTGTATFGAGSNGSFADVTVGESASVIASMTLDGANWNTSNLTIGVTGTGEVTAGDGEAVTVSGNAVLGQDADASGDLTVDGAALNGGTVVVGHDGTGDLAIGSGSTGSVSAVVLGEDAGASGTLTIDSGADWSVGSLTVGLTGNGQATVATGATATLGNILIGPDGNLAVTEAAASVGTVIAQQVTIDFGTLDVSAGGRVLIGAATGTDGAVAIGSSSSLTGLGSLNGNVVLSSDGLVEAMGPIPGVLTIAGNVHGTGTLEPQMALEVNGGVDAGVDIAFSPSSGAQAGILILDVPGAEGGTITAFGIGNTIDVQGSVYSTAIFTQGATGTAGTLTLSGSLFPPLSLLVSGTYAPDSFLATPGATDTVVTLIPCFAAGTRIATGNGDVPVEALTIGTQVRCLLGGAAPVVWIGRRYVDIRRHPDPRRVWPVLIERDAFAHRMPCRDLLLSPDHAVFADGVLIPIRYLANGRTIRQVPMDAVTYYHLELARHDVLLADGLPVESYLDSGDRGHFSNGGSPIILHPDFSTRVSEAMRCAPLVITGQDVADVRRRLEARAEVRGTRHGIGPRLFSNQPLSAIQ